METNAQNYDQLSQPQFEYGCRFVNELSLYPGVKVLDMGCGTGLITKHIADIIGPDGQVIGIDPDAERIKVAQEKYKDVGHLEFHVGSSVAGFPHETEAYYDFHITCNAFHWFPPQDKKSYLQKAYNSLKPGGKLAIFCSERQPEQTMNLRQYESLGFYFLSADELRELLREVGVFTDAEIKQVCSVIKFESIEIFKRWFKASAHIDMDKVDPALVKQGMAVNGVLFHDDGSVSFTPHNMSIIACKEST